MKKMMRRMIWQIITATITSKSPGLSNASNVHRRPRLCDGVTSQFYMKSMMMRTTMTTMTTKIMKKRKNSRRQPWLETFGPIQLRRPTTFAQWRRIEHDPANREYHDHHDNDNPRLALAPVVAI